MMAHATCTECNQLGFLSKVKKKLGKSLAKSAPLNSVRVLGLKLCNFEVGEKVYIGQDLIVASMISEETCYLEIGNRVSMAPRVTIILSSDANWSHLMAKIKPIRSYVKLEDDCWIGTGAIILPGITIGKCSIVGAGAVVTKDVPPYSVVAGVPAKVMKKIGKF